MNFFFKLNFFVLTFFIFILKIFSEDGSDQQEVYKILLKSSGITVSTVQELKDHYSGEVSWNENDGTLTFKASGIINFNRENEMSGIWAASREVKRIVIQPHVTVTGGFTLISGCTVEGEDQMGSVIFGTRISGLLHSKLIDATDGCMKYSSILAYGRITVNVKNLTSLNPVGYFFTGRNGAVFHLDNVRGIDNRGGHSNHSDGIQAAKGSTVNNCYFESGDDVIKVYSDITVENTMIKMIENSVPIQLGWGSYGDGAKGVFRNVTITGTGGRGKIPPVICGRSGKYSKTIIMEDCSIKNSFACLVKLYENGMKLSLAATNTNIAVQQFSDRSPGICDININGSKEQKNVYLP